MLFDLQRQRAKARPFPSKINNGNTNCYLVQLLYSRVKIEALKKEKISLRLLFKILITLNI